MNKAIALPVQRNMTIPSIICKYTYLNWYRGKSIESKLSEKDREIQAMKQKYEQDIQAIRDETNQRFNQIISMIQHNPKLVHVKPAILTKRNVG